MIKGKQQRRRNRRSASVATPPVAPSANVLTAVVSGANVIVTFDGAVIPQGTALPTTWRFGTGNHTVTSYVTVTASAITMSLSGSIASGQPYTIQGNDPALRTTYGGFVNGSYGVLG